MGVYGSKVFMSLNVSQRCDALIQEFTLSNDSATKAAASELEFINNQYSQGQDNKKSNKLLRYNVLICLNDHRSICSSAEARIKLEYHLIDLMPLGFIEKFYLKKTRQIPARLFKSSLDKALRKLTCTIPSYNFVSKRAGFLKKQLMCLYAKGLRKPGEVALDQILSLSRSLTKHHDVCDLDLDITDPALDKLVRNFNFGKEQYHGVVYTRAKRTFEIFLKSPYKMIGRSFLFGTFLSDRNLDERTYKILKNLLALSSIDYLELIFKKYFSSKAGGIKELEEFLDYLNSVMLYVEQKKLDKFGYSDNRKATAIIKPFKKLINSYSERHHLSTHIYRGQVGREKYLYVSKRKPLSMKKISNRKYKAFLMPASSLVALIVALGQMFIAMFSLRSIFPAGASLGISSSTGYTNTYLYKDDTKAAAKQFLYKGDFSSGMKSALGYAITIPLAVLALITGGTMAALTCFSVLSLVPGIAGIVIAAVLGGTTLLGYSSMMLRTGMRRAMELVNFVTHFKPSAIKKKIQNKYQVWRQDKIKNSIRFALKGLIYSSAIVLGGLSIVSTLGAWSSGTAGFLSVYLHLAPKIADIASKIIVFGFAGILKGTFNMSSIMHLVSGSSDFLISNLLFKPISFTKNMVLHPEMTSKKIAANMKKSVIATVSFIEQAKRNPWYTIIAKWKKTKGIFFDGAMTLLNALGSAALGYNGAGMLDIPPILAFLSSFGVSAGCNSRAMLAELDKEKTNVAPLLQTMDENNKDQENKSNDNIVRESRALEFFRGPSQKGGSIRRQVPSGVKPFKRQSGRVFPLTMRTGHSVVRDELPSPYRTGVVF